MKIVVILMSLISLSSSVYGGSPLVDLACGHLGKSVFVCLLRSETGNDYLRVEGINKKYIVPVKAVHRPGEEYSLVYEGVLVSNLEGEYEEEKFVIGLKSSVLSQQGVGIEPERNAFWGDERNTFQLYLQ